MRVVLMNPVFISVLVLTVLSLARVHVIFAILMAAITAGLLSNLSLSDTVSLFLGGMGGQSETALSYILLGIFAAMIAHSSITKLLIDKLLSVKKMSKYTLLLMIAGLTCLSGNLIPVHIAFIPILIPPLLIFFNYLRLDRRAVACALTFGLKMPYMLIPAGYGLIFHGIIVQEISSNGMPVTLSQVPFAMAIPTVGMFVGLFIAVFITYRKPRDYETAEERASQEQIFSSTVQLAATEGSVRHKLDLRDILTLVAIVAALVVQVLLHSLVIGALVGIIVMFVARVVTLSEGEMVVQEGVKLMGAIAFVMLLASGYATVLKDTGAVTSLVTAVEGYFSYGKVAGAALLLLIGLLVTMGIGTSFGTIPILTAVFVPICMVMGFSPLATIALIGTAGALGDAGSPASDSTLGPTSGLNADGKHHHIWDTCVPTFLHYNIPLFIFGIVAAVVL
ncbi:sodium:proton antiporter [Sporosarcina sp. P21c]|uniref:Na+/H+ antiporter family protein n=1 Tax=unclassified Sporosarcina TaxID=2647733 RepID=UPI000C1636B3|nr:MULTISPECIES: Na+/H+ antiporter NhaC family protein [unclassified Sporosarcina]PIC66127.1 sodium:proton antiporter [Sporosarcina sp. P16a]PIC88658.1 sodium:proton antiporter [Sporosarcina sp. P21c]PIC91729.1 sodium:proton antiporter [Sporosarcina sp. P25]